MFASESKRMIIIYVFPGMAKIMAIIILERINGNFEGLIDREKAGFCSRSSCSDHLNNFRMIMEQYAGFCFSSI